MNKKHIIIFSCVALIILLAGFFLGRKSSGSPAMDHSDSAQMSEKATIWTCSMHPHIQRSEPGDCPICGMDLIPLVDDSGDDLGPREMSMSKSSLALADIQTQTVQRVFPEKVIRLVGKLGYDETREQLLSARFSARIDRLFVNYTGITVEKGQHLATIYSPDLLTAQRELISAYKSDPHSSFTMAAKEKLRLWDLLPSQIDAILTSGEANDYFELKAPIGGIVVEKQVKEGEYVKLGQSLVKIVDFSELWLTLDAYESDLTWLRYGQSVEFSVEAFPGEIFNGKIAFIHPEVNRKTRTTQVRVNVSNTQNRLKPGMFAKGEVHARLAEGGKVFAPEFKGKWISPMHPEVIKDGPGQCDVCGMDLVPAETLGYMTGEVAKAPLIVPTSAVLRTGKRAVVYVRKPNTKRPTFEGREIILGPRTANHYIVISGLSEGDRVVTNGAFKIDSALQIQAKPSMMNPRGGGSTTGHNHGGSSMKTNTINHNQHQAQSLLIPVESAIRILDDYLKLHAALASDDFEVAKNITKKMMKTTGHAGVLPDLIHMMLGAKDIAEFRNPHFITLSNAMIKTVTENLQSFEKPLFLMNCPMANDNKGADWLQTNESLLNPYFGSMMLKCGEVKERLN